MLPAQSPSPWRPAAALAACLCALMAACDQGTRAAPWLQSTGLERSSAVDTLLFDRLPELIIAINHGTSTADLAATSDAARRLRAACPDEHPDLCTSLRDLAAALALTQLVPNSALDLSWRQLAVARRRVNQSLASARLGYYLDTIAMIQDDERVSLALSFAISAVRRFRARDRVVPVLEIERRDPLNWSYQLLGFTNDNSGLALVRSDLVDRKLASGLCAELGPTASPSAPWHEALRVELGGTARLAELAQLCQRRLERWNALGRRVAQSSLLELGEASGLRMTDEERSIASRVLDADQLDELDTIEQAIADHPALPLVREHLMRATAVHEAQHVLDQAAGLPVPASLSDIDDSALAEAAAAETSGYLAQIAHAPASARSSFARIRQLEENAELRGGPEQLAASLILNELAVTAPFSPDGLAHAAQQLWKQLFGRELVPLVSLD